MSGITRPLLNTDLFKVPTESLTLAEKITLGYHRARAIARAYGLTTKDVTNLTPKFWAYHQDLINPVDMAAFTLITIQYNLAAGTLAPFAHGRPDLQDLMKKIVNFDVSAQFLLTEVGHGLDARNLETTATLLDNGEFEIHTPCRRAAKYMPPTAPQPGFPRVGIVMARLLVNDEDRGIRPFIVWLNDGHQMCKGVEAKVLPRRAGCKPLDHSITTFNHVRLPSTSLLGKISDKVDFHSRIQRVHVGTLALSTVLIPMLKYAVCIAGKYSLRRHITGPDGLPKPIISFRTQQKPVLQALAQIAVYEAFATSSIRMFMNTGVKYPVRHGIAATFKAVVTNATQQTLYALAERCGAQGLFEYNGIIENQLTARGISIAEGDMLVLTIRLASELLLGRYSMPPAKDPSGLLARYERGMFEFCFHELQGIEHGHRSEEYNTRILPHCQALIEAIGNRMAYEAALEAGVDKDLLDLYDAGILLQSPALYLPVTGIDMRAECEKERQAMDAILPRLEQLLEETGAGPYATVPIVTQNSWEAFRDALPGYGAEKMVRYAQAAQSRL